MFLHNFVMKWLTEAIGNKPDYFIRGSAMSYFEKGTLTENDLQELEGKIEAKNYVEIVEENEVEE